VGPEVTIQPADMGERLWSKPLGACNLAVADHGKAHSEAGSVSGAVLSRPIKIATPSPVLLLSLTTVYPRRSASPEATPFATVALLSFAHIGACFTSTIVQALNVRCLNQDEVLVHPFGPCGLCGRCPLAWELQAISNWLCPLPR
jgi:hypothetical protein